ncbi:MAG: ERF family protein [Rhizobiaceae bacterium]
MQKSESIKNIVPAIISVMRDVKGMEKNSKVGSGANSYDGTKDQDVKEVFNEVMAEYGLCIVPTGVNETTDINTWTEKTQYGDKQRQNVFTRVTTSYLLMHVSGEWIELAGYGHGADPQDKSAGKATTYALKNVLLYSFLTPVGKIDDTDTTHSDDLPIKKPQQMTPKQATPPQKQHFVTQVTMNVVKSWKGGTFSKMNGKDTIWVDGVEYWMTPEQSEKLKKDPRYKDIK